MLSLLLPVCAHQQPDSDLIYKGNSFSSSGIIQLYTGITESALWFPAVCLLARLLTLLHICLLDWLTGCTHGARQCKISILGAANQPLLHRLQ